MDFDNDILRIFSALDTQNRGFIDKNNFLEKLLNFLSNSDVIEDKVIQRIEQLMQPYVKIGPNEFKNIYMEMQRLKDNVKMSDSDNLDSVHSSGSSDIDELIDERYSSKRIGKSLNQVKIGQCVKSESLLQSPGSAARHGRELMQNSKESFHRLVNNSLSLSAECTSGDTDDEHDARRLQMELEMEVLAERNSRLEERIGDLEAQLKDEERRYQAEKESHRAANERIYLLESAVHDVEIRCGDEMRTSADEWRNKMMSLQQSMDQATDEFHTRRGQLEKRLAAVVGENENLLLRCRQLSEENDTLAKDSQHWQAENQENETMLLEYKKVASEQVTELQTERDQLELMNMQLYNELQTIKHLSSSKPSKHLSASGDPEIPVRPRTVSEYRSPTKSPKGPLFSEPSSGSIESDANRLVHSLTMENRNLVERIAHLETVGFYQRQKLEAANCLSLAAEMEQLNIEELKKALTVERETVRTLQKYMETLTHKLLLAGHIEVFQQT